MTGQAAYGDPMPPEVSQYGFSKLNQMIDEFATERLNIYREQRVGPFNVTSGMGDATVPAPITIGPSGVWPTARPEYIDRAGVIYTAGNNPDPELKMHIFTTKEWGSVTVKGVTATLSRSLFYDRIFDNSGNGNIYLYPVPSAAFQVVLYVPVAVTEFPFDVNGNPDYTTVIYLPPGYRAMLISNLAVILSIGVTQVSDDLKERAIVSKGRIMAANVVTHMDALKCDEAVRDSDGRTSGWDWITGEIN